MAITTTFLRRNSAVRQASELPEEQFSLGIPVCPNPKESRTNPEAFPSISLWGFAIPTHSSSQIGSLQLPLSQSGKTSHQKQTFFSGGNSCVPSTSHNLFFSGGNYKFPIFLSAKFLRPFGSKRTEFERQSREIHCSTKKAATQNYKGMFNKGEIRLFSTAQYGLTIFWKER